MTIDQYRATVVQTIGENIQIRRILTLKKSADRSFGIYSHLGGKIVTVVEITGSEMKKLWLKILRCILLQLLQSICLRKKFLRRLSTMKKKSQSAQIKGKPENIVDKIVEGKINAFYDANCLIRQKYIRDDTLTIADLVNKRAKKPASL